MLHKWQNELTSKQSTEMDEIQRVRTREHRLGGGSEPRGNHLSTAEGQMMKWPAPHSSFLQAKHFNCLNLSSHIHLTSQPSNHLCRSHPSVPSLHFPRAAFVFNVTRSEQQEREPVSPRASLPLNWLGIPQFPKPHRHRPGGCGSSPASGHQQIVPTEK